MKCPKCNHKMSYDPGHPPIIGGPPDNWDPGTSPELWCPQCGYQATNEELEDFESDIGPFEDDD